VVGVRQAGRQAGSAQSLRCQCKHDMNWVMWSADALCVPSSVCKRLSAASLLGQSGIAVSGAAVLILLHMKPRHLAKTTTYDGCGPHVQQVS
jgi:hypothetical protein